MRADTSGGPGGPERAAGVQVADRAGRAAGSSTPPAFAFVIATLNGASTISATVAACARQADTFVVSDGSTDDTVGTARAAGATAAVQLESNVGKPAAIYQLVQRLRLLDRYDLVCIVDDDTIIDDNFVAETTAAFKPGVAVVCAKTASDWTRAQRWNPVVAGRAFGYWKYQAFIRRGQSALGVMNCISGSNSVYTSAFLGDVLRPDTPYVVDDTYWVLEAHRRQLGRVVYCPTTAARIQEPTTIRSWYRQNLRWLWGTFQGIIGHKVGRRATRFDVAYVGLMFDWLLYTLITPAILAFLLVANRHDPARLAHIGLLYVAGYATWSAVGAIALRKWRLLVLAPALLVLDWVARVNLLHAAVKAIRQPTSECRWESPARYAVAA
jgi:cellulose synthase/poly-beta-1,6-N-acetylglucosamine synthase-like glycosyltransferase